MASAVPRIAFVGFDSRTVKVSSSSSTTSPKTDAEIVAAGLPAGIVTVPPTAW